jgi:hypothetical protein
LTAFARGAAKREPSEPERRRSRRFRPPRLKDALGASLRPPRGRLLPPSFDALRALRAADAGPVQVEELAPPDEEPGAAWLRVPAGWGRGSGSAWVWMRRYRGRWWAQARDGLALVRHAGHWWWKNDGVWFLLHDGEPWGWRHFPEWERSGFVHPGTGTRLLYSDDGRRVAIVEPGQGAVVFDAVTGEELESFPAPREK